MTRSTQIRIFVAVSVILVLAAGFAGGLMAKAPEKKATPVKYTPVVSELSSQTVQAVDDLNKLFAIFLRPQE